MAMRAIGSSPSVGPFSYGADGSDVTDPALRNSSHPGCLHRRPVDKERMLAGTVPSSDLEPPTGVGRVTEVQPALLIRGRFLSLSCRWAEVDGAA